MMQWFAPEIVAKHVQPSGLRSNVGIVDDRGQIVEHKLTVGQRWSVTKQCQQDQQQK
jgi:hypothetical protein